MADEKKTMHRGWLETREGELFAPNTLAENIVNRDGSKYTDTVSSKFRDIDNTLNAITGESGTNFENLERDIDALENRATSLETRTQYMNATSSDAFYVCDKNGSVVARIDDDGINSINFTSYSSSTKINSLNDLSRESEIASQRISAVESRTQYMNAADSDAFYVTDKDGKVIARIDSTGVNSIDFTAYDSEDRRIIALKELHANVNNEINRAQQAEQNLQNTINALADDRVYPLEVKTANMNASGGDAFYVTAEDGSVVARIDSTGVNSINFTSYTDENTPIANLNDLKEQVDNSASEIARVESEYKASDTSINNHITAIEDDRIYPLEVKTEGLNASKDSDAFYVTDGEGHVVARIDSEGVHSINFTSYEDENTPIADLNILKAQADTSTSEIIRIESEYKSSDVAINNHITALENDRIYPLEIKTKNMNASEGSDSFAVTDGDGNVTFLVDSDGITKGTNFVTYSENGTKQIADLNNLKEVSDSHTSQISNLNNTLSATASAIRQEFAAADTEIRKDFAEADTSIRKDFADADTKIREDFTKADSDIQTDVTNKNNAMDVRVKSLESKTGFMNPIDEENGFSSFSNSVKIAEELDVNKIRMQDDKFYFTDNASPAHIIAQIDANGVTTTKVTANLQGNATSADKVNHTLKIGSAKAFDGSEDITIQPGDLGLSPTISATATDDDIVILTGTAGTNGVSYDAKHKKYSAYTKPESTKPSIEGVGASETIKIPKLIVDEYGHSSTTETEDVKITLPSYADTTSSTSGVIKPGGDVTITNGVITVNDDSHTHTKFNNNVQITGELDVNQIRMDDDEFYFTDSASPEANVIAKINKDGITSTSFNGNATSATKVNHTLKVGTKSFDGSSNIEIVPGDLGLANAMHFLGTTTSNIIDDSTVDSVIIGGNIKTAANGDVVLYGSKEFVWNGSKWEELGNEGSYKITQTAVADPSADGNSSTFIATISQDTNGNITATKKNVQIDISAVNNLTNRLNTLDTKTQYITSTTGLTNIANNVKIDNELDVNKIKMDDDEFYFTDSASPANIIAKINASGVTSTNFNGALKGNADTASKVNHSLKIGTADAFDGSKDITIQPGDLGLSTTITAGAKDDGIVTLKGTAGTNGVSYEVAHKDYNNNTYNKGASTAPVYTGTSFKQGIVVIPEMQVTLEGHAHTLSDETINLPELASGATAGLVYQGAGSDVTINNGIITVNDDSHTHTKFNNNVQITGELDVNTLKMQSDAYHFIDKNNKVLATFDANGITATKFNGAVNGNATSADKVNNSFSVGGITFDGSSAKTITPIATDDDVVVLTASTSGISYDAKHAKKGPSNGTKTYTSGNTTTTIAGHSDQKTIKIPQITVDTYGHVTAATDEDITITLPPAPSNDTITLVAGDGLSGGGSFTLNGSTTTVNFDVTPGTGLKIASDKVALKVATSAEIGGIKSGGDITIATDGTVSIVDDSHNHVISNIDNLDNRLNTLDTKTRYIESPTEGWTNIANSVSIANELDVNKIRMDDNEFYFTDSASPANIIAKINSSGVISTAFTGALKGNADTATKVNNSFSIGGVTFDGSSAKTIVPKATDDDVVVLTASATGIEYDVKHAKKGPSKTYISDNTTTSVAPGYGASAKFKIPQITVDTYGHVTAAADEEITVTLPGLPAIGDIGGLENRLKTLETKTTKQTYDSTKNLVKFGNGGSDFTKVHVGGDLEVFGTINALSSMSIAGNINSQSNATFLGSVTANSVITDQLEIDSNVFYFTDATGKIIAQIDANGLTTSRATIKNSNITNGLGVCLIDVTKTITINNI